PGLGCHRRHARAICRLPARGPQVRREVGQGFRVEAGLVEIDVEDIEYLRHGDKPLLARLFKPKGAGPFPLVIDLHGGAWCVGDRLRDTPINEPLARSGVVVAALDFRMPPDASYPGSFVDINYAIRWFK